VYANTGFSVIAKLMSLRTVNITYVFARETLPNPRMKLNLLL